MHKDPHDVANVDAAVVQRMIDAYGECRMWAAVLLCTSDASHRSLHGSLCSDKRCRCLMVQSNLHSRDRSVRGILIPDRCLQGDREDDETDLVEDEPPAMAADSC